VQFKIRLILDIHANSCVLNCADIHTFSGLLEDDNLHPEYIT